MQVPFMCGNPPVYQIIVNEELREQHLLEFRRMTGHLVQTTLELQTLHGSNTIIIYH